MPDLLPKLTEKIRLHYQNKSQLSNYMEIKRSDNQQFDRIPFSPHFQGFDISNATEFDEIGEEIAKQLVATEFSHFLSTIVTVECKTKETTLENLVSTLVKFYNDLWDDGYEPDQLYMPYLLKNEVRKRKNLTSPGIPFFNKILHPISERPLGEKQIIFANKRCFRKTYPENIEKQILVSERMGVQDIEIDCTIVQKIWVVNPQGMSKIIVTDSDKLR